MDKDEVTCYLNGMKRGDDCLAQFINYSYNYLQSVAYKCLKDKTLVEDVLFMSYAKIYLSIDTFNDQKNGMSWISTIVQNEAYNINTLNENIGIPFNITTESFLARESLEDKLILDYDMEQAILQLDEQSQKLLHLNKKCDLTIREIAKIMNIPKSTIAYKIDRALKSLHNILYEENGEND